MANKIQIRRGQKSALPTLSSGEPAYTTDTRELFVGTGSGNVNMGGSHWYMGTAMSGTSTTTGAYSYSACPQVKLDDMYLNTSNGNVYVCTMAGSGSSAKWTYQGCIKGPQGDTSTSSATSVVSSVEELQPAINSLPSSGGKIILREGTYTITQPLTCNKDIIFEGMGVGTVISVTGVTSLINNTAGKRITFRDVKIIANDGETAVETNNDGLFKIHSYTELYLDNSDIRISILGSGTDDGTAICRAGTVYCSNTTISADVDSEYDGTCYMVFRNCDVYASFCDITISRTNNSAAIFYNCSGKVVGGSLSALNAADIMHDENNISISVCTVSCRSISKSADLKGGVFADCEITAHDVCFCVADVSNCRLVTGSNRFEFRGYKFTNNRVINSAANTFAFGAYSIVKDNISKYTLSSTTPSGGKMSDNVVCSSLS